MHLTDISIRALKPPPSGQTTYYDDALKGFGVRVSQGGTRTFVLIHGTKRKRVTLGRVGVVKLADARAKARDFLAHRQLNGEQEITTTFAEGLARFMESYRAKNKPSTVAETDRLLTRHLKPDLDGKKLVDITRGEVVEIIDRLFPRPSECAHCFTAAKTFFRWCRRYGLPDLLDGVEKPTRSVARTRLITPQEFRQIWSTAATLGPYGSLVRLLFTTGQRAGQLAALHCDYLDRQRRLIRWPPSLMKSNKEHAVPYADLTAAILDTHPQEGLLFPTEREVPFNSWSDSKKLLDALCPLPHWTHHDARRFFSSTHAQIGTPLHLTEKLLAHTGGVISGVSAIYNLYEWSHELKAATAGYESHLAKLILGS